MPTIRITWTDSTSQGVIGTKIYRDDVEIGDVGNGVETFDDTVSDGTYKYEVQAYSATDETTQEVIGVNVETISTTPAITNYVFNGDANAYFLDETVAKDLLDKIGVEQTWFMRVKRTQLGVQQGILGCGNAINAIKLEVDANDNQMDGGLDDTGQATFTNASVALDANWHTYAMTYDLTDGLGIYQNGVFLKDDGDVDFTARTAGRTLAFGAAVIGGGTPGLLIGEANILQGYSRKLTDVEILALHNDPTNIPTSGLVVNFADNKEADKWIAENSGTAPLYELTNQGGVTTN